LNAHGPGEQLAHDSEVKYSCDPGFQLKSSPSEEFAILKCQLGKLDPQPMCIKTNQSTEGENAKQEDNPAAAASTSCHSPQKIENALRYFGELFQQRLHLIGIAQFDQQTVATTKKFNESQFPFQYEDGTEIIFRCVSYTSPGILARVDPFGVNSTTTAPPTTSTELPEKSTWIIKCEAGNWIGRSFECGKFFNLRCASLELILLIEEDPTLVTTVQSELEASTEEFHPEIQKTPENPLPCHFISTEPNLLLFNGSDQMQISNWSAPLPHDTMILLRCRDIGKYRLSGPRERLCQNGKWIPNNGNDGYDEQTDSTTCTGLNQEFDYDGNSTETGFQAINFLL